ncbi:hypothetical protein U1Q18_021968 [Sarracenia purpurea var. burkii]
MRFRRQKRRSLVARFPSRNLVVAQVKILKHSKELKQMSTPASRKNDQRFDDEDLKVVDELYAGLEALLALPLPSSLPFMSFFANKENHDE